MKRVLLLITLLLLPNLALAQTWPERSETYINDIADMIEAGTESRLLADLELLREETGVEISVLTLLNRAEYQATGTLAEFATELYNKWGFEDAEKNNGILVLVLSEDREISIDLGTGYSDAYNSLSQMIIDRIFVPSLRIGDTSAAIAEGTWAVNHGIARAHAAGEIASETVPEKPVTVPTTTETSGEPKSKKSLYIFGGGFLALIMAVIFGKRVKDRVSACPSCGKRGMNTERTVNEAATEESEGNGTETVTCTHCDHLETSTYTIAKIKPETGKSDGKGGASGKW